MNKIFKVVWSKVKHCYVVVSEIAKNTTSGGARRSRVRKGALAAAMAAAVLTGSFAMPNSAWAANGPAPANSYVAIHNDGYKYIKDEDKNNYRSVSLDGIIFWVRNGFHVTGWEKEGNKIIITEVSADPLALNTDALQSTKTSVDNIFISDDDVATTRRGYYLKTTDTQTYAAVTNGGGTTAFVQKKEKNDDSASNLYGYNLIVNNKIITDGIDTWDNKYGKVVKAKYEDGRYYYESEDETVKKEVNVKSVYYLTSKHFPEGNEMWSGDNAPYVFLYNSGTDNKPVWEVYDGVVYGNNGEVLSTGVDGAGNIYTYWASESNDLYTPVTKMTVSELNTRIEEHAKNMAELAKADFNSISLTSAGINNVIAFNDLAGDTIDSINVSVTGGTVDSPGNRKVLFSHGEERFELETGSIVSANDEEDWVEVTSLKDITINGQKYTIAAPSTVEDTNTYVNSISVDRVDDNSNAAKVNFIHNDKTEGYGVTFVGEGSVTVAAVDGQVKISATDKYVDKTQSSYNTVTKELVLKLSDGTEVIKADLSAITSGLSSTDYRLVNGTADVTETIKGYVVSGDGTVELKVQNGDDKKDTKTVTIGGIATKEDITNLKNIVDVGWKLKAGASDEGHDIVPTGEVKLVSNNENDLKIERTENPGEVKFTVADMRVKSGSASYYTVNNQLPSDKKIGDGTITLISGDNKTATIDGLHDYYTTDVSVASVNDGAKVAFDRNDSENKYGFSIIGGSNVNVTADNDDNITVSVADSVFASKNNLKVENVNDGSKQGVWKITDTASDTAVYTNTVLSSVTEDDDDDYGRNYIITDTADNSITLMDIASATKLKNINAQVTTNANNITTINDTISTLNGNDIESIRVNSGNNSGSVDLLRKSKTNGSNDVVPGSLTFTSGVGTNGNQVISITGADSNVINLDAGSIVKANDDVDGNSTVQDPLEKLEVNGKVYSVATSDSVTSAAAAAKTVVKASTNSIDNSVVDKLVKNIDVTKTTGGNGQDIYTISIADMRVVSGIADYSTGKINLTNGDGTTAEITGLHDYYVTSGNVSYATDSDNGTLILNREGVSGTVEIKDLKNTYTTGVKIAANTDGARVQFNRNDGDDKYNVTFVGGENVIVTSDDTNKSITIKAADYKLVQGSDTISATKKGYVVDADGTVDLKVQNGTAIETVTIGGIATKTQQDTNTKKLTGTVMYDAQGEGYNYNSIHLGETGTSNYSNKAGGVKVTNVAYAVTDKNDTVNYDGSAAVNVDLLNDRIATVTTQATAAKTTLSETGKNITVGAISNQDGSTKYTVNLNDNITLGDASKTNVNIDGTNGSITALTTNDGGTVTGKVEINSSNSTITVGTDSAKQVVIDGTTGDIKAGKVQIDGDGTISGLINTTWNANADYSTSDKAATEAQLQQAVTTAINNSVAVAKTEVRTNNNNIAVVITNSGDTNNNNQIDSGEVSGHDVYTISGTDTIATGNVTVAENGTITLNHVDVDGNVIQDGNGNAVTTVINGLKDYSLVANTKDNALRADEKGVIELVSKDAYSNNKTYTYIADVASASKLTDVEGKVNTNTQTIQEHTTKIESNTTKIDKEIVDRQIADYEILEQVKGNDQYLDSRINQLGSKVNKVGAGAAALAALHPMDFDPDDKLSFAVGAGNYAGETATALGAFYRPNEKVMMNVAGTYGNGENMVNMGVSFALDRTNHVSNSRTAMAKEIVDLREQVATQGQQIAQLIALVNQLAGTPAAKNPAEILFPDIPENHWAYEYIHSLAARGIVEGYPDGNFGGDRTMTRYEFATMLFKAMQKGVVLSEQIRQEFEKELGRIRVDRVKGADDDANKIERVRVNADVDRDDYGSKIVQVKH